MVAIGTVMFTSREHIIALEARGKGLLGVTLRYKCELRKENEYFDRYPTEKVPKDMLELATHIVETKAARFEPEKFEDHYENALTELLKKKQSGRKIAPAAGRESTKVINLMDALRKSINAEKKRANGETRPQACGRADRNVVSNTRKEIQASGDQEAGTLQRAKEVGELNGVVQRSFIPYGKRVAARSDSHQETTHVS